MERRLNTFKQADAILTSDWHLREDQPVCRTDNFQEALWHKVDFIYALQIKHGCPVLNAGDLFNHWKPSPELLSNASIHMPYHFHTIYGQHDLPQHSLDLAFKSGLYNLEQNSRLNVLDGCSWGQTPDEPSVLIHLSKDKTVKILVWHVYNYQGKTWPGNTSPMAAKLLRQYPQYDLILTGDNHRPFVEEYKGRLLVNPGSLMRSTADQIDHKPRVYLWYAETNTVQPIYLPIEDNVISREHIEIEAHREGRKMAFIEHLDTDWQAEVSFEENVELFEKSNNVRKSVMNIVYKAIEK